MCRGFKSLHQRLIHHYQVELTLDEEQLLKLDQEDFANGNMHYRLYKTRPKDGWDGEHNWDITKKHLIEEIIEPKIKKYGELATKQRLQSDVK